MCHAYKDCYDYYYVQLWPHADPRAEHDTLTLQDAILNGDNYTKRVRKTQSGKKERKLILPKFVFCVSSSLGNLGLQPKPNSLLGWQPKLDSVVVKTIRLLILPQHPLDAPMLPHHQAQCWVR